MNGLEGHNLLRRGSRRAAPALAALLLVSTLPGPTEAADRLRLGLGLTSYYTDNLLQYSDDQIRLFDAGTSPAHFSIDAVADGVHSPWASLAWETRRPGGRGREIRLRGSGEFHQRNATADFRAVGLRWRELFGRDRRLTLGGYYLPSYYLRQLFDEDYVPPVAGGSRYRRAEFSLGIGSIAWRQGLARRLRGEAGYQYEHRGYNADFEERTSDTHQGEVLIEWVRLPRRGTVGARAGYRKSSARADDSDGIPNDDPDISYHGILAGASGKMDFNRGRAWRFSGALDYEYATRDYESDRATDTAHHGRSDRRHTIQASIQCEAPADVTARIFYRLEDNAASFPATGGPSGDPASYTENQVGIALSWSTLLWRSRGVEPGPSEEAP